MMIIGLTGPTGAGKSTVASLFRARGLYIADADLAARKVMQPGSPVLADVANAFGADVLLPDGSLDRRTLALRAFASEEGVQTLNRLTHPAIDRLLFSDIALHADAPAAVIDAAALIESGIFEKCDLVAVVLAPLEMRLSRIMARDGLSRADAMLRIGAQKDDAFYTSHADVTLWNDGAHDLQTQIDQLMERLPV